MLHFVAFAVAALQYIMYTAISTALQYLVYHRCNDSAHKWRTQPGRGVVSDAERRAWWFPLAAVVTGFRKTDRHPNHVLFAVGHCGLSTD